MITLTPKQKKLRSEVIYARVSEEALLKAKGMAAQNGLSLSELVEELIRLVGENEAQPKVSSHSLEGEEEYTMAKAKKVKKSAGKKK